MGSNPTVSTKPIIQSPETGGFMEINAGFFTVEILKEIETADDLTAAKQRAVNAVNDQPNARAKNTKKALSVITKARSKNELLISLANFMLAHPSEGLSMQKGEKK